MNECIFCAVIRRETPGSFVYEDDDVVAFLDLYPVNDGHTLVVPKRHVADLTSCPQATAGRLFEVSARLGPAVVRATKADGFNVWTANGASAGQTVFHLHLHVLPRFADDSFGIKFPKHYPREAMRDALDEIAERIRSTA